VAPGTGLLRLTRAAIFAVGAVGLASAAHLAADGDVSAPAVLLSFPVVMIVVHLLAAGRRGPVGLFLGLGLTQIALHLAFMAASVATTCVPPPTMSTMAMTGGHPHLAPICESVTGHDAAGRLWPSPSMALAHVLASVLLVLLLARGEAAVWALASCLRFRSLIPGAVLLPPAARQLPVPAAVARRVPKAVHLRMVRRRGPPTAVAVA
jgi:hypothetical protein